MKTILIFILFVFSSGNLFSQEGWDSWKPYSSESYYEVNQNSQDHSLKKKYDIFNPRFYVSKMQNRFLSVDRFADKYPSLTPYQYAANNPVLFIDANGDTIFVSDAMKNSEALLEYLNTEEGYKQISQYAYKNQSIVVAGKTFSFTQAGKYSTQNVNFAGISQKGAHTIPTNSIEGDYYVGDTGVQTYNIFISASSNTQVLADDIFHEVQHVELFSIGGADGFGNFGSTIGTGVQKLHHQYMLTRAFFNQHGNFLSEIGASSSFTNSVIISLMGQAGISEYKGQLPKNIGIYIPEVRQILKKRINFMK